MTKGPVVECAFVNYAGGQAMVGDGINDAPRSPRPTWGCSGPGVAIEATDITLVGADPTQSRPRSSSPG